MNRTWSKIGIVVVILLVPALFPILAWADGPEYTTEEILQLIEANEGPEGLDLSGKDLSGIDLSRERIQAELAKVRKKDPEAKPMWWANWEVMDPKIRIQGINLERANLLGANLWGANLQGAHLLGTHFEGAWLNNANLQGAELGGANLQGAQLDGANLQGADLDLANLQGARLMGANLQGAYLRHSKLQGARLDWANLRGAFLCEANLQGVSLSEADLQKAHLEFTDLTDVNFLYARSLDGIYLFGANLSRTNLSAQQLGESVGEERKANETSIKTIYRIYYCKAKEVYRALKANFREIGRYDDAMWAYRKERLMERKVLWANRSYGRWFVSLVIDLASGYGLDPYRVLGSSGLIVTLFAWAYWFVGGLGSREEEMPPHSRHPRDWLRSLNYSIAAFATMVYSGLEPRTPLTQTLSSAEAILGIIMLALLMFVIGNRIGGI